MNSILKALMILSFFAQSALATDSDGSVFAIGGTVRASDGSPTGYQGAQVGVEYNTKNPNVGIDYFYYNEGTPSNNHRDGFAAMAMYRKKLTDRLTAMAGVGPYLTMNTTTINGEQLNKKDVGAVAALAVLYRIYGTNLHLRAQYTHAQVRGSVNTDTLFVGVGYAYVKEPEQSVAEKNISEKNISFGVMGGNSHTTRAGADMVRGFQVEVKKMASNDMAYSVSVVEEGDTNVTDRSGIVGQVWYVTKSTTGWEFNIGAGPYIAYDRIENKTKLVSMASMRLSKQITPTVRIGITFNRVMTSNDKDQDMFLFGVEKQF